MLPEVVGTVAPTADVDHSTEAQPQDSKLGTGTAKSDCLEDEINNLHKELTEENQRMDRILDQIADHFSSLLLPMDVAELSRIVALIEELDKERKELNEWMDGLPRKLLDLLSCRKEPKMDADEFARVAAEIDKFDRKQKESAKNMDRHMQKLFDHCSSMLSLQDEMDAAESASDLFEEIEDLDNERREADKNIKCISQQLIDVLMQRKLPLISTADINSLHDKLIESSKSLDHIMQELIGHCSSLFCEHEDAGMDAPECIQLVAEIGKLEKERSKGVNWMDHILQQLTDLFSPGKGLEMDGAENARLVSEFLKFDKKQREGAIMMDYFMDEISAHCYSRLACIFNVTFEE